MIESGAAESELELHAKLDVSRRTGCAVPHPERGARDISVECRVVGTGEDVPVEQVEKLGAELQVDVLRDSRVLHEVEVHVVVTEAAQVGDARSFSPIKIEAVGGFECALVE